ncbi:transmembrane and ubiquitin-like domain-containing 1 [Pelobates cultripes]|uniref:Transmembrane and ubiquitin-like domain-containing protein 1 n=1 Tax=Pelobates cultripes TaxID=61616 RepID=A0AAD1VYT6_PELCU|nr:transmembrane and ubiquitin-like domain-containing 1 [Pelobates cultripes]
MALIEGVGDEVTILFALILLLFVLVLAWISTHTVERLPSVWLPPVTDPVDTSSSNQAISVALVNAGAIPSNRDGSHVNIDSVQHFIPECSGSAQSNKEGCANIDRTLNSKKPSTCAGDSSPFIDPALNNDEPSACTDPTLSNREPSPTIVFSLRNGEHCPNNDSTVSNEEPCPNIDPTVDNVGSSIDTDAHLCNEKHNSIIENIEESPTGSNNDPTPNTHPTIRQRGPREAERNPIDDAITLRLKFLNDTERLLTVRPSDTLLQVKRIHFPGQETQVRLIYQGQLLRDDSQTVSALQLRDGCVLHCHISQHASGQGPGGPELAQVPLNIGSMLVPLLGLIVIILWYCQIQYPYAFSATASACLGGVTLLIGVMAFSSYRR